MYLVTRSVAAGKSPQGWAFWSKIFRPSRLSYEGTLSPTGAPFGRPTRPLAPILWGGGGNLL